MVDVGVDGVEVEHVDGGHQQAKDLQGLHRNEDVEETPCQVAAQEQDRYQDHQQCQDQGSIHKPTGYEQLILEHTSGGPDAHRRRRLVGACTWPLHIHPCRLVHLDDFERRRMVTLAAALLPISDLIHIQREALRRVGGAPWEPFVVGKLLRVELALTVQDPADAEEPEGV